ncbi:MAG: phytase [Candidatus Cloacimonetes bacterium]|jgi:3-phytase|nr:phytase [Candidatus Cloacimonadota bacterium]
MNHKILIKQLVTSIVFTGIVLSAIIGCAVDNSCKVIKPKVVTQKVIHDSDDPAIWINPVDPAKSLIIGTDKDTEGAIYVYNLDGEIIEEKTIRNLKRPNNVDIEYGLMLTGQLTDIAVTTERETNKIRIYSLPEMKPIDNGGIEVFVGEELRAPMGVSLYKRVSDDAIFAIVGRKEGPLENYLWQYIIEDDGTGNVKATLVRKFGNYSGLKEIESIAVDDQLGYVYYSDEQYGVRKYHADPDVENANEELGIISTLDYIEDNEGISIYCIDDKTGYILVSDQSANRFRIYPREGTLAEIDIEDPEDNVPARPHLHKLLKIVDVSTNQSDGSEVTSVALGDKFPNGLFVAMSDNQTYQLYDWADIAGNDLVIATKK